MFEWNEKEGFSVPCFLMGNLVGGVLFPWDMNMLPPHTLELLLGGHFLFNYIIISIGIYSVALFYFPWGFGIFAYM